MGTPKQIQDCIHLCALMVNVLKDERPLTGLETQLLEARLRHVMAELDMKKMRERQARAKVGQTAPLPGGPRG